ncbi:MAG TPA: hypothetical protein VL068_08110, partial [Microthrixaceae bacterium]|nr:hypothetical protein [Microthrixaceae bacterium]
LSIFNMTTADVIIDVSGWMPAGADYTALNPARLGETRPKRTTIDDKANSTGAYAGSRALKVTARGGVPATGVGAVVLNVTTTQAIGDGYTTVYPTGESRPTTSNGNFIRGRDKANLVISKVGTGGTVQIYNSVRTDIVVDVLGWFPTGSDYSALQPARFVDTRDRRTTIDSRDLAGGSFVGERTYQVLDRGEVPSRGSAVVLNVTVTESKLPGYVTVFASGDARPVASNVNFYAGQTTANLVVATVGTGGRVTIYNSVNAHMVVDVFGWLPGFVPESGEQDTNQISIATDPVAGTPVPGNSNSGSVSVSGDGRFTAFSSDATNLVDGDSNGFSDVFVRDAQTKLTTRVSLPSADLPSGDKQADRESSNPKISADGRYVAFESAARNLVATDGNSRTDVFVHDRDTATTRRVSVGIGGAEGNDTSDSPSISADGGLVAFRSDATNMAAGDSNSRSDVFVRDMVAGVTSRVSVDNDGAEGNNDSNDPAISGDGRSVVFKSFATNLIVGDSNAKVDIFVRNLNSGTTTLISRSSLGALSTGVLDDPSINSDGRFVTFRSDATNLVAGDTNGHIDVFLHDTTTGDTTRVSVASDGTESNGNSTRSAISGSGRYITFDSVAKNLVAGDTNHWGDVFVRDMDLLTTSRVSVGPGNVDADNPSSFPSISTNGRYIGFSSNASNLIAGGDGSVSQVYVTRKP